jgi:hypothetical protein
MLRLFVIMPRGVGNLARSYMREEEGGRGACAQTTLDPEHGGTWQAVAGRGFVASGAAELRAAGSCFSLSLPVSLASARWVYLDLLKPLASIILNQASFILNHFLAFA